MADSFDASILKKLYVPHTSSHKGMNGKLMVIGGSQLFHAAFLWALKISSRIVDMVFYSSVDENNQIVKEAKLGFQDGIVVRRADIEDYIEEADCVLIGPGLMRAGYSFTPTEDYNLKNLGELAEIEHEGIQTYYLTKYLLKKYPQKKWVIDGGSLQMIPPELLPKGSIVTPHTREFIKLFGREVSEESVKEMAEKYDIIIVAKGEKDIVCSKEICILIEGGNAGMTKGGTGDVLAGLIASLGCKNDLWTAAVAGSYLNKKAAESLEKRVGIYFNASDLADEIPKVMQTLL